MAKTMKKLPLAKRSQLNVLGAVNHNGKIYNQAWNVASKAPVFTKKDTKMGDRKIVRTNRCTSSHAWRVLSSGAAAHVAEVAEKEAGLMRLSPELEARSAPGLFSLSKGYVSFLEAFLVAYAVTIISRATALKDAIKKQKKLSFKAVAIAARSVDEQLWSAHGLSPNVFRAPMPASKKKATVSKEAKKAKETRDGGAELASWVEGA
jgi:hypothetical protein